MNIIEFSILSACEQRGVYVPTNANLKEKVAAKLAKAMKAKGVLVPVKTGGFRLSDMGAHMLRSEQDRVARLTVVPFSLSY